MASKKNGDFSLKNGDAVILVDVQNDFIPGGKLSVPQGDKVPLVINRYIEMAKSKGLPIFATRDWHPADHSSFKEQGGPWPPHCVAGTRGAEFATDLNLPSDASIISKGTKVERDAYSGFGETDLDEKLRAAGIKRLLIGGLATDYCVLNTVKDALNLGYKVLLMEDAIRAVNVRPEDGRKAVEEMIGLGAVPIDVVMITD